MFAKYWLPVVVWAVVIYSASGDKKSVHHSSRIIEPIVRWLVPNISDEAVRTTVLVVRKCAHLTEYAIFAVILWWALRGTFASEQTGWTRRLVLSAWSGAVLFAISDEWHQSYVPGRQGSPWDVLIDAVGAASGLFFLWRISRWRTARRSLKTEAPAIHKD
ncbi:MAG: VanZ family protein [Verrucomicrobiota bacterium]